MTKNLTVSLKSRIPDADFSFEGRRSGLFWAILRARAGLLIKINLMLLLFCAPAILAVFYYMMDNSAVGIFLPFSSNVGIGYPMITDTHAAANSLYLVNNIFMHLGVTLGIVSLCVGLSGAFYAMRTVARGETFPVIKTFFTGIKKHWLPFLCAAPILAGLYFLIAGGFAAYSALALSAGLKIFLLVLIIMVAAYVLFAALFYFTQAVTFKIKPAELLKNSFILAFALLPRNFFIAVFSAIPILLAYFMMSVSIINMFALMLAALFLFSFIILLWTVYAHWVFHKHFEAYADKPDESGAQPAKKTVEVKASKIEKITEQESPQAEEESIEVSEQVNEDINEAVNGEAPEKSEPSQPPEKPSSPKTNAPQKKSSNAAYKFKKK
ncbi:MAG: hypothetical protein FWH03_08435 [Firmicutes bacterium]|nr:hypothetical protein [Bacillota bacterium]